MQFHVSHKYPQIIHKFMLYKTKQNYERKKNERKKSNECHNLKIKRYLLILLVYFLYVDWKVDRPIQHVREWCRILQVLLRPLGMDTSAKSVPLPKYL